jgi:hypothetical protein
MDDDGEIEGEEEAAEEYDIAGERMESKVGVGTESSSPPLSSSSSSSLIEGSVAADEPPFGFPRQASDGGSTSTSAVARFTGPAGMVGRQMAVKSYIVRAKVVLPVKLFVEDETVATSSR